MENDWKEIPLGELLTLQRGFDLPARERKPGIVPIVSSSGVSGTHSEAKVSGPGVVTGRYGTIGQAYYVEQDFWPLNTTLFVSDFKGNDPRFISYLLPTLDFGSFNDKSTVPGVNRNDLHRIIVNAPPLPEQRVIAYTLQTVQKAIQARRCEADLERERKAALMQHLFTYGMQGSTGATKETPFGHIPEPWHIMLLESCAFVQTGITKGRDLEGHNTVTRPYLRVANVQDGYLDLSEMKEIELLAPEVDRYLLQPGDVVMTEGGDFDKLGRGFIWQGQVPNCVHQNHIFAVRVNRDLLLPQFFAYLIQSSYGKAYFLSVAHRTTNLASINSTKLKALPTLLPPLSEQQEIVAVLDACDTKLTVLEQEKRLLEELFRALLEELMIGRLSTVPLVAVEVAHD